MSEVSTSLKEQGKAVMIMMGIGIMAVLSMVIVDQFGPAAASTFTSNSTQNQALNATIQARLTAFIAGFALVGTFAVVTMLVIVVKAIIGVVRGLK